MDFRNGGEAGQCGCELDWGFGGFSPGWVVGSRGEVMGRGYLQTSPRRAS